MMGIRFPLAAFYRENKMHPNEENEDKNKFYFKFDVNAFSKHLDNYFYDLFKEYDLDDFFEQSKKHFENYMFQAYAEPTPLIDANTFMLLGKNSYDETVYKNKFFAVDTIHIEYLNHLRSYPAYFLQQPKYYRGMFEILN